MSRRRASLSVLAGMVANTALVAVQSVVLIPMYVRVVGERLYGAWLGTGELLTWMLVSDLGVADVLVQRIGAAHGRRDDRAVGEWFATGVLLLAGIAVLLAGAGVGASYLLPGLYGLEGEDAATLQRAFALAAAATSVTVVFNAFYGYARATQRTGRLAAASAVSNVAVFAVSLALVLSGWGLMSIAWGLAARAVVLAGGIAAAIAWDVPPEVRRAFRFRRGMLGEVVRAAPATGMAVAAYVAMNQSELLIVSLLLGPEAAAVYMLNRRAMDLARSLSDAVVWSAFGSFAHLVGSEERHRALDVYRELLSARTALALASGAAFVALNGSFVDRWVGEGRFAGQALTVLLAAQALVAGNAFLANYLYRATGAVVEGSLLLVAEGVLRVGLMVALAAPLGMAGVPVAGIATGALFLWIGHRRLLAAGARLGSADRRVPRRFWAAGAAVFAASAALGGWVRMPSWGYVLAGGALFAGAALLALVWSNDCLRRYRVGMTTRIAALKGI